VAARYQRNRLRIRPIARDGRQNSAALVGTQQRDASAIMADVSATQGADDWSRQATKR